MIARIVGCIILFVGCVTLLYLSCDSFAFGIEDTIDPPFDGMVGSNDGDQATDIGQVFYDEAIDDTQGVLQGILDAFRINYIDDSGGQTASYYIKEIINRALAILGLIALSVFLYASYQIFFSGDHEGSVENAKKLMKHAVLALIAIALSWFLVSRFFKIYTIIVDPASIEIQ